MRGAWLFGGLLLSAACVCRAGPAAQPTYPVAVRVTQRVLNTVKPLVFGDNIEWVHDGMGFWVPERKAFDERLVGELKNAGVTNLRYPGGTLSDYFDWSHAVGSGRQPQPNPFEKGRTEMPAFGPDEFMALCRRLRIPGMITLNAGTGTPEMAGEWARYCRDRRFPVSAFEVGNEIYMADPKNESVPSLPVAKSADEYVAFFLRCRAAIGAAAPGVPVGAVGLLDTGSLPLSRDREWLRKVFRGIGNRMDFISLHNGYAPAVRATGFGPQAKRVTDDEFAATLLGASVYVEENLEATKRLMKECLPDSGRRVDIHITEHGPLVYPFDQAHAREDAAWNRSLAGALYQACLFNVFLRDPKVTSTNHLPLCQDVFGALIGIRGAGGKRQVWRNAVYHVFRMYADLAGSDVVGTAVSAPSRATVSAGIVPALPAVPLLDAAAYRARDGRTTRVFLINRDLARSASVRLEPGRKGYRVTSVTVLTGSSYLAENTPERPDTVVPRTTPGPAGIQRAAVTVSVPPHSLAVVTIVAASR